MQSNSILIVGVLFFSRFCSIFKWKSFSRHWFRMHKGNLKIVLIFQLLLKLFEWNSLESGNVIFRAWDIFRKNGVLIVCQPQTTVAAKYGNLKGDYRTFVMRKVMTTMNIFPFNCYTRFPMTWSPWGPAPSPQGYEHEI